MFGLLFRVIGTHSRMLGSFCRQTLLFLLLFSVLSGCDESTVKNFPSTGQRDFIDIGEIRIPVFITAEEQLNYTRSWFADIQEKRAALQAFHQLFPEAKKLGGVAALELAYLQLGNDFRFTLEHASFAAIKDYRRILEEYREFDNISVKALWYIGWIYSNLLGDSTKGIAHFTELVENYPNEKVMLLPPAPWVSIIYEADDTINTALYNQPVNHWAALALLEIIKHSNDSEEAWLAFDSLWHNYRQDKATGFALKAILKQRSHVDEVLERARQYMEKNFSNVHILGDIQKEINALTDTSGGSA